jgi:hypothetical protein
MLFIRERERERKKKRKKNLQEIESN